VGCGLWIARRVDGWLLSVIMDAGSAGVKCELVSVHDGFTVSGTTATLVATNS
jgi:hypothetical protein